MPDQKNQQDLKEEKSESKLKEALNLNNMPEQEKFGRKEVGPAPAVEMPIQAGKEKAPTSRAEAKAARAEAILSPAAEKTESKIQAEPEKAKAKIEAILDKNLEKFYNYLEPGQKEKIEKSKSQAIAQILNLLEMGIPAEQQKQIGEKIRGILTSLRDFLLAKNKHNAQRHKLESHIYRLLSQVPNQNKYYLRQQTKIIVDEILKLQISG